MGQTYHSLWIHFVWSTKKRQPLISKDWKWKLYKKFKEISDDHKYHLDHVNGIEDHVHLLTELNPKFSPSEVVKDLKGISWRWIIDSHLAADDYFEWQDGFAAFSVSPSNLQQVRKYIQNQEAHHRQQSFADELKWMREIAKTLP